MAPCYSCPPPPLVQYFLYTCNPFRTVPPSSSSYSSSCNPSFNVSYASTTTTMILPPSNNSTTPCLVFPELTTESPELFACRPSTGMTPEQTANPNISPSAITTASVAGESLPAQLSGFVSLPILKARLQQPPLSTTKRTAATGFSISLWMHPTLLVAKPEAVTEGYEAKFNSWEAIQPILALGESYHFPNREWNSTTSSQMAGIAKPISSSPCDSSRIRLSQFQNYFVLQYQESDLAQSCLTLRIPMMPTSSTLVHPIGTSRENNTTTIQHVVISWSSTTSPTILNVFRNGEPVLTNISTIFDTTLSDWMAPLFHIQLFTDVPYSNSIFHGSIREFAIIDSAVDVMQVAQLYHDKRREKSTPSIPVILATGPSPTDAATITSTPVIVPQDGLNQTVCFLSSLNTSTHMLPLAIELLSQPLHGDINNGIATLGSMIFPIPVNNTGLWFNYNLVDTKYFTEPSIDGRGNRLDDISPEILDFRIVGLDRRSGQVVAISMPDQQLFSIVHVNHMPHLYAPQQVEWNAYKKGDTPPATKSTVISGIMVDDSIDRDLDRVRVDVITQRGELTLSTPNQSWADFESCSKRSYSQWQCSGNGVQDRSMTFVALPTDVVQILANLTYHTLDPWGNDTITIRIHDGAGGSCLSQYEQITYQLGLGNTYTTIHRECFVVEAIIKVPSWHGSFSYGNNNNHHLGWLGISPSSLKNIHWLAVLVWTIILFCFCSCMNCFCRYTRCGSWSRRQVIMKPHPHQTMFETDYPSHSHLEGQVV